MENKMMNQILKKAAEENVTIAVNEDRIFTVGDSINLVCRNKNFFSGHAMVNNEKLNVELLWKGDHFEVVSCDSLNVRLNEMELISENMYLIDTLHFLGFRYMKVSLV